MIILFGQISTKRQHHCTNKQFFIVVATYLRGVLMSICLKYSIATLNQTKNYDLLNLPVARPPAEAVKKDRVLTREESQLSLRLKSFYGVLLKDKLKSAESSPLLNCLFCILLSPRLLPPLFNRKTPPISLTLSRTV